MKLIPTDVRSSSSLSVYLSIFLARSSYYVRSFERARFCRNPDVSGFLEPSVGGSFGEAASDRAGESSRMRPVDRDMAQFGPSKVVPREKIITYLGQTSRYPCSLVLMQVEQAGGHTCACACT